MDRSPRKTPWVKGYVIETQGGAYSSRGHGPNVLIVGAFTLRDSIIILFWNSNRPIAARELSTRLACSVRATAIDSNNESRSARDRRSPRGVGSHTADHWLPSPRPPLQNLSRPAGSTSRRLDSRFLKAFLTSVYPTSGPRGPLACWCGNL